MAMNINSLSNTGIHIYHTQVEKLNDSTISGEKISVENSDTEKKKQISDEERQNKMQEFWAFHDELWAKQTAAAMSKVAEGQGVAIEIARRMSGGNKVSDADEKTLMGFSPNMYTAAKLSQMMAERQKDLSEDSLTDKFNEKHKNDRRDWTTEINEKMVELLGDNDSSDESSDSISLENSSFQSKALGSIFNSTHVSIDVNV